MIKVGDRVKLSEAGLRLKRFTNKGRAVHWSNRRGIIVRVGSYVVYVKWDDCKGVQGQAYASEFVEKVN